MDFTLPRMKSVDMKVEGEVNHKIDEIVININRSGSKNEN
jgi:hypothetical protein